MSAQQKVSIVVDGVEYKVFKGTNVVDALRLLGFEVPTLCWSAGIEPCLGTCRVCSIKINGRDEAACTRLVEEGLNIECNKAEIKELRQAVVELLFAEGNHFCPGCEKSGDCELQTRAYELGVTHSRFPYQFTHYSLDYRGKKLLLERNRCIHCKRCTDLFVDDNNKKVFSFVGKGKDTRVMMDLELEANLAEHKCLEAVQLCPVGAIIYKGQGFDRPIGTRSYDHESLQYPVLGESQGGDHE